MSADELRFVEMASNECHANSMVLACAEDDLRYATGYALSGDGVWRSHSWAVDQHGKVVESTVPRQLYFGVFPLVEDMLKKLSLPAKSEIDALTARVEELTAQIEELTKEAVQE